MVFREVCLFKPPSGATVLSVIQISDLKEKPIIWQVKEKEKHKVKVLSVQYYAILCGLLDILYTTLRLADGAQHCGSQFM